MTKTHRELLNSELQIASEDPALPQCMALVEAHWDEMAVLYGEAAEPCQFKASDISGEGCAFLIVRIGGEPVACGAVRHYGGKEGEVKRVFVARDARNRGVARRIMEALEQEAVNFGYTSLRLETGTLQPFAIKLYERLGYTQIDTYGPYKDDPRSVCYAKQLA